MVKESKVNADQYIVLQGWMISDLKLKGNELVIYACIYGFSQADWTNSTKQSVVKCLKSLVEKGYVVKTDKVINGVKFCEYYATKFNGVCNKVEQGIQQSLTGGMQQSLTNNIDIDNLSNNKEICERLSHTVSFSNLTSSEMVLSSLEYIAIGDVSNSPLCIGGYSCLLRSFNIGVSIGYASHWFIFIFS